jgi:precorrin-4/cobalt-precorrin-4 C11-methyltransferase
VISFIGAGPGAADLITLRGAERLARADVVVWAASLVPRELLDGCRPDAVIHDSKTMTLADVCAVFAAHPTAAIARLHSGDPTVYSAIGEQIAWCRANDRPFEVVPGVSAMHAAAAEAGCELTIPGVAQSVVITRVAGRTRASMPDRETIEAYAATGATLAVFLSVVHVDELTRRLLAPGTAYEPDTPAVIAYRVSWPQQQVVATTIGQLPDDVRTLGIDSTTVLLVGPALAGAGARLSHVYDPGYATRFRAAVAVEADRA